MTQPRPDSDRGGPRAAAADNNKDDSSRKPRAALFGGESAQRAVYVISVAAELAGVHPQTLRVYERKGLVDPSRTGGGNRRYSQRDIERLRHIGMLTSSGMNLQGVRHVLELEAEVERLTAELERVREEARDAVEQTHRKYRRDLVPLRQAMVFRRAGTADAPRRGGS